MKGIRERLARIRRRSPLALLLLGILMVGVGGWVWVQYLTTRTVPDLPLATTALGLNQPLYASSIYGVDQPLAVAVSPGGERIYAAEGGGERLIRIFDSKGNALGSFAPPDTNKSNRRPAYVAVSPQGLVYVTDTTRPGIGVYSADGQLQGIFNPKIGDGEVWQPLAITFDREGNLYVSDISGKDHRILAFSPDGKVLSQLQGQFSFPNGLAVDDTGRIYVADSNNGRVEVYDRSGQLLTMVRQGAVGQPLGLPRGIVLDRDGRLNVVDTLDHTVQVFKLGSTLKRQFALGAYGYGDGQFAYPNGIAIDGQGHIYIADRENNRVQIWF